MLRIDRLQKLSRMLKSKLLINSCMKKYFNTIKHRKNYHQIMKQIFEKRSQKLFTNFCY